MADLEGAEQVDSSFRTASDGGMERGRGIKGKGICQELECGGERCRGGVIGMGRSQGRGGVGGGGEEPLS